MSLLLVVFAAAPEATVESRFAAWVEHGERSAAALTAVLAPELREWLVRDLGSGLRRIIFESDDRSMSIEAVLVDSTVLYVMAHDGDVKREFDRQKLLRHLASTTGARDIKVPAKLVAAYQRLFLPYEELVVGKSCGWGYHRPQGKQDIELLIRAGRFDLIENVLLGANPEGRVFAAQALDGRDLSAESRARVEALFASPLRIRNCRADIIFMSPAADLRER